MSYNTRLSNVHIQSCTCIVMNEKSSKEHYHSVSVKSFAWSLKQLEAWCLRDETDDVTHKCIQQKFRRFSPKHWTALWTRARRHTCSFDCWLLIIKQRLILSNILTSLTVFPTRYWRHWSKRHLTTFARERRSQLLQFYPRCFCCQNKLTSSLLVPLTSQPARTATSLQR